MDNGIGRNFGDLLRGGKRINVSKVAAESARHWPDRTGSDRHAGRRQKDLRHIAGGGTGRRRTVQVV